MKRHNNRKKKFQPTSIHDELLFRTDEEKFLAQNIIVTDYENVYTQNFDCGDDRLYLGRNHSDYKKEFYFHISPHILAWHENVPAEIVYNNELSKRELTSKIVKWWMNTNTETVVIYQHPTMYKLVPFFTYRNKVESDKILNLNLVIQFLIECLNFFKSYALFPTILSPKRIFVNTITNKLGFYENGHFQFLPWPVNESVRITDNVFSHPQSRTYAPDNQFKYAQSVKLQSKIFGLLNFYIGSVLLIYFCLTGSTNPVKNTIYKEEKKLCKIPNGICKSLLCYNPRYYDFFHRCYCIIGLKTLANNLKTSFQFNENADEFLKIYEELITMIKSL